MWCWCGSWTCTGDFVCMSTPGTSKKIDSFYSYPGKSIHLDDKSSPKGTFGGFLRCFLSNPMKGLKCVLDYWRPDGLTYNDLLRLPIHTGRLLYLTYRARLSLSLEFFPRVERRQTNAPRALFHTFACVRVYVTDLAFVFHLHPKISRIM